MKVKIGSQPYQRDGMLYPPGTILEFPDDEIPSATWQVWDGGAWKNVQVTKGKDGKPTTARPVDPPKPSAPVTVAKAPVKVVEPAKKETVVDLPPKELHGKPEARADKHK